MKLTIKKLSSVSVEACFFQKGGILLVLALTMVSLLMYPHNDSSKSSVEYYDGGYNHIKIDWEKSTARFYQIDSTHHPVFSDTIRRGEFVINNIYKNFYILNNISDVSTCWNDMTVTTSPSRSENLSVKFNIPYLKNNYLLKVYSIGQDSILIEKFRNNKMYLFLPDSIGYEFALIPHDSPMEFVPQSILGFNNTIKFITIPIEGNILKENRQIEIYIPLMKDDIFDLWNINGELLRIDNDKIKWNGSEFKKYN